MDLIFNLLSKENFKTSDVYKIIHFIEFFCIKSLKKIDNETYKLVKNILDKIKEKFTLKDFAEILLNYFNTNSTWVDMSYFILLLSGKTISYDKLGFLILYENKKDKFNKIIDFIYNSCILRDSNDENLVIKNFG